MESYKRSLFLKIGIWVLNIFFIYEFVLMIIAKNINLIFIPIFCFVFFSLFTVIIHVNYIFTNDSIIIKYPFLKKREYMTNDIIGFEFSGSGVEYWFIIYFNNNKKIRMEISGKKFKEKIKKISEEYYEKIYSKNIETIKTTGLNLFISGSTIIFFDNRVEVSGKTKKVYYYNNDIKNMKYFEIVGKFKNLFILTNDNYEIKLLSNKCNGGIGLFEYLMKVIKCPNRRI